MVESPERCPENFLVGNEENTKTHQNVRAKLIKRASPKENAIKSK
jgi:hypothetical protein